MMPYIFCLAVNLASFACIVWLGWLVWRGASAWLIAVMAIMAIFIIIPGKDIFTCPKCGQVGEIKVYQISWAGTVAVQKDAKKPD